MLDFDGQACEEAAGYYHDFLLDPGDVSIPRLVAEHIGRCGHCREQVRCLGEMLAETEGANGPGQREADKDLITELARHFEHIGDELGCEQVKPLLPSLLLGPLRIRIPTPVTVHVDHCLECRRDLAALGALALDEAQLTQLSRLYEKGLGEGPRVCPGDPSQATILGSMSLEGVDIAFIEHVCLCPTCRGRVYEHRQEQLDRQRREGRDVGEHCGRELSMAELFEYVVPCGPSQTDGKRAGRESEDVGDHVWSCPRCLEQLQVLHRVVYGVLDRADSEVVTVYRTQADGHVEPEPAGGLYAGHPIDVQVAGAELEPAVPSGRAGAGVRASLRRAVGSPTLRPVFRTAFLAAAMIPLAIVFWASTHSASGLSVGQISDIVANAPAVHIETFYSILPEPLEDIWISDEIVIWKGPGRHTVYDLAKRRKAEVGFGSSGTWTAAGNSELDPIRRAVNDRLAIAGRRAKLHLVAGDDVSMTDGDNEVYEVIWHDRDSRGTPVYRRQMVSLDPATKRPRMIRFSTQIDGAWELGATTRVTYPDPSEIAERAEALLGSQGAETE